MKNLLNKLLIMALAGGLGLLARAAAPTMFVDSLELKVGSITDETKSFEGLPVLIKVYESDEKFPGFMISRTGGLDGNGSDIRFSQNNVILPHEMVAAEEDENGKYVSFSFWVRVPTVAKDSTITMHWGVKDGQRPPANRSSLVWSDYLGVWHKAGLTDKSVADASGNHLDAILIDGTDETETAFQYLAVPGNILPKFEADGFTFTANYKADENLTPAPASEWVNAPILFGTWSSNRKNYLANHGLDTGWGGGWWGQNQIIFRGSSRDPRGDGDDWMGLNSGTKFNYKNRTFIAFTANSLKELHVYAATDSATLTECTHRNSKGWITPGENKMLRLTRFGAYEMSEARLAKVPRDADWLKEEYAAMSNENYVTLADGAQHVIAQGENYWVREPSLSPLAFSDPSKVILDVGQAKFGGPSPTSFSVQDAAGKKKFSGGFADLADPEKNPAGFGAYRVVVTTSDIDNEGKPIKQLQKIIYFAYVSEVMSQDLRDNQTMLFNDIEGSDKINDQSFILGSNWIHPTVVETNDVEYTRVADEHLTHKRGWRLRYGTIGNSRESDAVGSDLDPLKNYLPFGKDVGALSYKNPGAAAEDLIDAGAAILYNYSDKTDPAAVYSPVYTQGIGEVYFDAVNMDCDYRNRLELQYMTLSDVTNALGRADATMDEITNDLWANAKHTFGALEILQIKEGVKANVWTNRSYVPLMMMKNSDKANTSSFYRVRAKLNLAEPVIFRIARTDSSWGAGGLTGPGKILVDNILVSDPTTVVKLHRLEDTWDPERDFGKYLHGDRGTLTKRFPKVGDTNVRAKVGVTYEGFGSNELATRAKNVAALIFKYRRRYLNANLGEKGEWKSVRMECADPESGSIFMTPESEPLDLGEEGESAFDVEYAFEYTPNPTSYDYFDYFGLADCSFAARAMDSATTLPYRGVDEGITHTPTLGDDFFFRLREGASDYEQMELLWQFADEKGATSSIVTNNLHLIDDHLWTGAITVTNANARFGFKMRGVNKNELGENGYWILDTDDKDVESSPYSTIAMALEGEQDELAGYKWLSADVVKNTRQFVVRFNDNTGAFSICRGDYQDFNHWTDAAAKSEDKFVAHAGQVGDDGVTIPIANSILQQRFPSDPSKNVFEDWQENVSSDELWQEKFTTTWNENEQARTGTTLLGTTTGERTFNNGWVGHNFMYVNESLNNLFSSSYNSRAALLEGKGRGSFECDESSRYPDGIGEINFDARLGQQHTYDRISTYQPNGDDFTDKDYLVSTRVVMSSRATSATDLGFDGQGTISIFAYHNASGSYEFRMKRLSRNELELGLYRWYQEKTGAPLKVKEIYRAVRNATGYDSDTNAGRVPGTTLCSTKLADGEGENTTAYVAFLSVKSIYEGEGANRTFVGNQLYAGFTNNNGAGGAFSNRPSVATDIAGREMKWHSFYAQDRGFTDSNNRQVKPLRNGTFGFLSTDCPARFMRPQVHNALDRISGRNLAYADTIALPPVRVDDGNTYIKSLKNDSDAKNDFWDHWYIAPSADIGKWNVLNEDYYGIVTPEVTQKIVVSTRPKNSSEWSEFKKVDVASFNYSSITIPAHTTTPTCVRLSTYDDGDDSPRCDVILDNLEMTQWHATTTANLSSLDNGKFVFTGVWTESVKGSKKAEFWPLRVATDELQTIRSPFLEHGIGAISISYDLETLDERAVLDIEYVSDEDLADYNVVNYTNNSRYQDEWQQYKRFNYDDLVAAGGRITEYIGLRGKPSLIRLRVPQSVIEAAHTDTDNGEYGRIDIKSIAVWDEPNVDERSWTAWNVRVANANTAAKEYVSYDKLLNIDSWLDRSEASGMSMELNNGILDIAENDPDFYRAHLPYIQSPALTTPEDKNSGITVGEINFRARKSGFDTEDACVGIYAVKDLKGDDKDMVLVGTTNLTTTAWQNITIKNKESGVVAIRLVIMDKDAEGNPVHSDRALFDELSVTERVDPNVVVTFARPFRSDLSFTAPVATITLPEEQPLCREEFGIQCELALKQLEPVIIPETIEVWCDYYIESFYNLSDSNWGYSLWKGDDDSNKRGTIKLSPAVNAADPSRLIYRMTRHTDGSADYIPPVETPNTVVQYNFRITFKTTQDEDIHEAAPFNPNDVNQWTIPEWYYPVDLNSDYAGASAYTIIDNVAPKRAWINEVNAWDARDLNQEGAIETTTNSWVEIAIPSGVDMTDWRLEAVSTVNDKKKIMTYALMTFGDGCASSLSSNDPFAFYVVANKKSAVAHDAVMDIPSYSSLGYTDEIFDGSALSYFTPYALRLVRPTGIVDHEILVGAGNDVYEQLDSIYDDLVDGETGHNKTVITAMDNYAAFDAQGNSVTVSMKNVAMSTDLAASKSWDNTKTATPGALNIDQTIADDYMIYPNDDTLRVLCTVSGEGGIEQDIGNGRTIDSQLTTVAKGKGEAVTIWYYLAPWYEIGTIFVNGVEVENLQLGRDENTGAYSFSYVPEMNTTIEAVSRTTKVLTDLINDEDYPNGNPYESAILDWMRTEYPTLDPEKLANNLTELVDASGNVYGNLTLTEMYWIGADPSTPEWKLVFWNSAPTPDDNIVDEFGDSVIRMTLHIEYTNGAISKKLTNLASRTYGINSANWKSSDVEVKFEDWTSNGPTLQVIGSLWATSPHGVSLADRYVPIKCYILDANSFDDDCECEVYLPDPFGPLSITGAYLDWNKYSRDTFIGWKLQLGERSEKLPGYSLDYLR